MAHLSVEAAEPSNREALAHRGRPACSLLRGQRAQVAGFRLPRDSHLLIEDTEAVPREGKLRMSGVDGVPQDLQSPPETALRFPVVALAVSIARPRQEGPARSDEAFGFGKGSKGAFGSLRQGQLHEPRLWASIARAGPL